MPLALCFVRLGVIFGFVWARISTICMWAISRILIITSLIINLRLISFPKNRFFVMVLLVCCYITLRRNFIKTHFGVMNYFCHFLTMILFPNLTRYLLESSYQLLKRKTIRFCLSLFFAGRFIKFNSSL